MRALMLILIALASPAIAQTTAEPAADLVAGKAAFKPCTACHAIGEGATNRMGPLLTGVVGRPAASVERFGYSAAMKKARDLGLIWTPQSLDAFLTGPHDYVPGTKMTNIQVKEAADRANLIAYLKSFSPDFNPDEQVSTYKPPG